MQIILNGKVPEAALMSGGSLFGALRDAFAPKAGETVVATVIFASDAAVNIKLENGTLVRAALEGTAPLSEGDEVRFRVGCNDGRRILLIPEEIMKPAGAAPDRTPQAAGTARGPDDGSPIAAAAARCGYPVTPELAARAARILSEYPQAEVETAVFLAANDIPPTPENIETARALYRSEFKTGRLLSDILDLYFGKASASIEAGDAAEAGAPARPAEKAPGNGGGPSPATDRSAPRTEATETRAPEEAPGAFGRAAEPKEPFGDGRADPSAQAGHSGEAPKASPETRGPSAAPPGRPPSGAETTRSGIPAAQGESHAAGTPPETFTPAAGGTARRENAGPGGFQDFDPRAVPSPGQSAAPPSGSGGAALKRAVTALPAELETLRDYALRSSGDGAEAALGKIDVLASGIGFFRGILPFVFIQIPLLSGGRRETAELYVFRRKKARGTAPGDLSVVLALDTANLGHVEALLRLRGRGVSVRFTAAGEAQADTIRGHFAQLAELLSRAGFRLSDMQAAVSEEKITPIGALAAFPEDLSDHHRINFRI